MDAPLRISIEIDPRTARRSAEHMCQPGVPGFLEFRVGELDGAGALEQLPRLRRPARRDPTPDSVGP